MNRLHSVLLCALLAPAITLGAGAVLAAEGDDGDTDVGEQSMGHDADEEKQSPGHDEDATESQYNSDESTGDENRDPADLREEGEEQSPPGDDDSAGQ